MSDTGVKLSEQNKFARIKRCFVKKVRECFFCGFSSILAVISAGRLPVFHSK